MNIEDLQTGDILICTGKGEVADGISKATGSSYTHTAQIQRQGNRILVFDAQNEGAFPREIKNWLKEFNYDFRVYRFNSDFDKDIFNDACVDLYGLNYGYKHLTLGFWGKIFRNKNVKQKYAEDGRVICTELTMRLMWVFRIKILDPQNYTPNDVNEFLPKNNFSFIGKYFSNK